MLRLTHTLRAGRPFCVLCLGAHSDDIEIGCGGTVLRLLEENPATALHWVVLSAEGVRGEEAARSADRFLVDVAHREVILKEFKDGFFPYLGADIKRFFEELKARFCPDLILTHYRQDLHQDHRLVAELTWSTFRDHLILEYEIPKYDGDIGAPNFFVPLDEPTCTKKVDHILECFPSQRGKAWFSKDTFYAMLRLRGLESNAPEKYAEAFYCRKMVY